jgi:hypothetical protein
MDAGEVPVYTTQEGKEGRGGESKKEKIKGDSI